MRLSQFFMVKPPVGNDVLERVKRLWVR